MLTNVGLPGRAPIQTSRSGGGKRDVAACLIAGGGSVEARFQARAGSRRRAYSPGARAPKETARSRRAVSRSAYGPRRGGCPGAAGPII